jgi:hypothetical protein
MDSRNASMIDPRLMKILFHPDGDAGDGDATAGEAKKEGTGRKIELSDEEYKALLESRTKVESLEKEVGEHRTRFEKAKKGLGGDKAALVEFLRESGVDPTDAEAAFDEKEEEEPVRSKKRRQPEPEPDDEDDVDVESIQREERIRSMEGTLSKMQEKQARDWMRETDSAIGNTIQETIDRSKEVATLVLRAKALQSEDDDSAVEKLQSTLREEIQDQVRSSVMKALREEQQRTGKKWDDNWMKTVVPKAAQQAVTDRVGRLAKIIPDPASLGRSISPNPFLSSDGKMPPVPKYEKGKTTDTVRNEIHKWGAALLLNDEE